MKNYLLFLVLVTSNISIAQVSDFKAIDFTIADNVAALHKGASLKNLPVLAYKLTHKLPTDVEKFRAIYRWVCTNIKGDYYQQDKVIRKRKNYKNDSLALLQWNNNYAKTALKTLIHKKRTMCTGYAYLIKELCFFANLDCEIIDGYGRLATSNVKNLELANHAWNAVKLNNKWYLCDATWSSGYTSSDSKFISAYNDGYFLTDPTLFAKNHYPLQEKWLLNTTLIQSKFNAPPLVYGETFKHRIVPVTPKDMNIVVKQNTAVMFSFKSLSNGAEPNITNNVTLVKYFRAHEHVLKIKELRQEHDLTTFKHTFNNKGFYDVHVKINNDIVATYTIEVTKG